MKYSIAIAALAGVANAIVAFTNSGYSVEPGQSFELQWSGATGPVTITLKTGPKDNLQTVTVLGSGLTATSTTVTIPSTLPPGLYAFEIRDGSTINYSPQFNFAGTGTALPTVSGASSTTGSATTGSATTTGATTTSTGSSATTSESTSASKTSRSTTAAPSQTQVVNTNAAQRQGSSLALLLVSAAALYYFS